MLDDLRYAVRSLLSSRGFTLVALFVIALGVGAITPIFSIVDAVALRQLPYPDANRLVVLRDTDPDSRGGGPNTAAQNYLDWRREQRVFESLAAVRGGSGEAENPQGDKAVISLGRVSGEFFRVLAVPPQLGRSLDNQDETHQRRVAVISHGLWQRLYGGRREAVGELLYLQGQPYEIVGVAAREFIYPASGNSPRDVFVPLTIPPQDRSRARRGLGYLTVIGRLAPGVSFEQATAEMERITANIARDFPDWDVRVFARRYRDWVVGPVRSWMTLLLWGVALVLLIACANVANLLIARSGVRRHEIAVRAALGATRPRIARQLLIESLLLSTVGTAIGVVLGWWALAYLRESLPAGLPRASQIALDMRVLVVATIAAVATSGLFGLAPAVFGSRVHLSEVMKSGGRGVGGGGAGSRFRNTLIVGEIATALVLLVGALLFITSFRNVTSIDLGLDYRNVLELQLDYIFQDRNANYAARQREWGPAGQLLNRRAAEFAARVAKVPGVIDAATISSTPFSGGRGGHSYSLPGRERQPSFSGMDGMIHLVLVSPNANRMLGMKLIRGRFLNEGDDAAAPGAMLVSESAAQMIWPGEDPVGQEIHSQKRYRVVGVVSDVRYGGPEVNPWPDVYVPASQGVGTLGATLLVRTKMPLQSIAPAITAAIRDIDPGQPEPVIEPLELGLAKLLAQRRFNMLVVGLFGLLAVVISSIGVYGVMSYLVTQRTHEIGVRIALGASRGRVLRLVLAKAGVLTAAGLAIGGVGVWYFSTMVRSFLFELEPLDVRVITAAAAVMIAMAFAASVIPARRAASVDPLIALRQE